MVYLQRLELERDRKGAGKDVLRSRGVLEADVRASLLLVHWSFPTRHLQMFAGQQHRGDSSGIVCRSEEAGMVMAGREPADKVPLRGPGRQQLHFGVVELLQQLFAPRRWSIVAAIGPFVGSVSDIH